MTDLLPARRTADPRRPLRAGRASLRYRPRVLAVGVVATGALLLLVGWSMTLGTFAVPLPEVFTTVFGLGSGEYDFVVRTLRLPRLLAAVGVGGALAMSGAIFQALVRNPLVAPDIVGVTSGASLTAVVLIVVTRQPAMVPVGALVGALVTTAAVYALTWRRGITGNRLVLVGIGVNALLIALTTFVIVRFPVEQIAPAILWTTGTLYARSWTHVGWLAVGLALLVPAALALTPRLRMLQLGDAASSALGNRTEASRGALLAVGAGLAAVAVAVGGPIGFVALMVPHAVRMLLGPLSGGVLVVTGLAGAILVVASDAVAQHALPAALPVGVVTAAIGAPYFLFLLHRMNRGM